MTAAESRTLAAFVNEPVSNFSTPAERAAAQAALERIRPKFGQEYDLLIAGARHKTADLLPSVNPSRPSEIIGVHHKATTALAARAIEDAHAFFDEWRRTPAAARVEMAVRVASILTHFIGIPSVGSIGLPSRHLVSVVAAAPSWLEARDHCPAAGAGNCARVIGPAGPDAAGAAAGVTGAAATATTALP